MTLLAINYILNCVQVFSTSSATGRSYNCPIQEINGELFFTFKKQLHKVADYTTELTTIIKKKG